jgi:hypothetical protein
MERHERTPLEQVWLRILDGEVQLTAQAIRIGELLSLRNGVPRSVTSIHPLLVRLTVPSVALLSAALDVGDYLNEQAHMRERVAF